MAVIAIPPQRLLGKLAPTDKAAPEPGVAQSAPPRPQAAAPSSQDLALRGQSAEPLRQPAPVIAVKPMSPAAAKAPAPAPAVAAALQPAPRAAEARTITPAPAKAATAAAKPPAAPPPAAKAAEPPQDGGVRVQVGAFPTQAQADAAWRDVAAAWPRETAGKRFDNAAAALDGKTTHRALISGFSTRAEAKAFCARLMAASRACFVK